jgi:hypothetical protein
MADVYMFNVRLNELENIIWRDIEITSVSSAVKLGYAVLAAFGCTGSHLFNIRFHGRRYEIVFEKDFRSNEPVIDPRRVKLSDLKLKAGDELSMEYDYGAGWKFEIELLSITEMKRGTGGHYPYVSDGKGRGIIEDISPDELAEIVERTDQDGTLPKVKNIYSHMVPWDYREFSLQYCNAFFKDILLQMQYAYEELV